MKLWQGNIERLTIYCRVDLCYLLAIVEINAASDVKSMLCMIAYGLMDGCFTAHQHSKVIGANQRFYIAFCGLSVTSYDRQANRRPYIP